MNILRFHHGLDWVGKQQADFLRWRSHFYKQLPNSPFVPFVGYDLWYRFNGNNFFQNLWIDLGAEYKVENFLIRINYRRITQFENRPGWRRHILVFGIFHTLAAK